MSWTQIDADWASSAHAFSARYPETDAKAVAALQGNLKGLREYLAISHDLTLAEAGEAVDDWTATLRQMPARAA